MILVTVGTSRFDALVEEVDRLVGERLLHENVVAQIGKGSYVPRYIRYFRFMRFLSGAYEKASLVVSAGGAGTTIECAQKGIPLVVVENKSLMEGHQAQLIGEMARRGHLVWCHEISNLANCIAEAKNRTFPRFISNAPRAHELILRLLKKDKGVT